jgi:hypothetical protein
MCPELRITAPEVALDPFGTSQSGLAVWPGWLAKGAGAAAVGAPDTARIIAPASAVAPASPRRGRDVHLLVRGGPANGIGPAGLSADGCARWGD